jgi:mRNA-degrading endonuclease RelE of RelBE toxin-antitoxin system
MLSDKARGQLRALSKAVRKSIGKRIELMREGLTGDVLKLKDKGDRYRLRVGNYRVLFTLESSTIKVYRVVDRKEAYE